MNNNQLKTPRPTIARWPKTLPRCDFIEDVNNLITLLIRVKGPPTSNSFYKWMYQYIYVIRQNKEKIFWGKQINDAIYEKLTKVPTILNFYMTSYLVYVAASMRHFPGLSTFRDIREIEVHKYYSQLVLQNSFSHFWRVKDAFFGYHMCMLNKDLYNKRVFDHSWEVVNQYGFL